MTDPCNVTNRKDNKIKSSISKVKKDCSTKYSIDFKKNQFFIPTRELTSSMKKLINDVNFFQCQP